MSPLSPSIKRVVREVVAAPAELAGREVVVIDADACGLRFTCNTSCGLVRNHRGECWECSDGLIEQAGGAFALLAVPKAGQD